MSRTTLEGGEWWPKWPGMSCVRTPSRGLELAFEVVDDGHDQADDDHDNKPDIDGPPIPRRHGNDAHGAAL